MMSAQVEVPDVQRTDFFRARLRIALYAEPRDYLCQVVEDQGEKFLWVDGVAAMAVEGISPRPVLLPISSALALQYIGEFSDLIQEYEPQAIKACLDAGGLQSSPLIMLRSLEVMRSEPDLEASAVVLMCMQDALDIIEAERNEHSAAFALRMVPAGA